MPESRRVQLALIVGMAVSVLGSEIVRIYAHQPEYFEHQWIGMAGWYAVALLAGGLLALLTARLARIRLWVLTGLFWVYAAIQLNVALGGRIDGMSAQASLAGGLAFALVLILKGIPSAFRRTAIHAACFMAVFASLSYDLLDWIGLASGNGSKGSVRAVAPTPATQSPAKGHVFEILLDAMPGYDYLHDPDLSREAFFKNVPAGIYYPNTYTNGHRTSVTLKQLFAGTFTGKSRDGKGLFQHLDEHGYRIGFFSEIEKNSCQDIPASLCRDRKWALEAGLFRGRRLKYLLFQMDQLLHAYFLRIHLPGLSESVSVAAPFEKRVNSRDVRSLRRARIGLQKQGKSGSLILFREFLQELPRLKEPSYNFLHLRLPHTPNIHDRDCNVIGSDSQIMEEASPVQPGRPNQALCANKLAGIFLAELQRLGLFDPSMIIIHSDHGDGLGYLNFLKDSDYFGLQTGMPPEEIVERRGRALLWIKPPHFKGNETREHTALLLDLPPTISSILGLGWSPAEGMDLLTGYSRERAKLLNARQIYAKNYFDHKDGRRLPYVVKRLPSGAWQEASTDEALAAARKQFLLSDAPRP